ncbi:MAG TPA: BNR-4 repeat-containing protein [Polyangiaceae bacterium]
MRTAIKSLIALSLIAGCAAEESSDDDDDTPGTGGSSGAAQSGSSGTGPKAGTGGTGVAGSAGSGTSGSAGSVNAGSGGGGAGVSNTGGSSSGSGGSGVAGSAAGTAPVAGAAGTGVAGGGAGGTDPAGGTGGTPAGGTSGASGASGSGGSGGGMDGGFVSCPYTPPADPSGNNAVVGEMVTFNDDGAWTWYCDERAVVDAAGGKIIVSSDANGSSRNGNVDAVVYDVATKMSTRKALGDLAPDDHNVAALLVKPDGKYLAAWAGHNENCNTYWSNHDGSQWENQKTFSWSSIGCPTSSGRSVTYNNLWNMTAENKIYNIVRSRDTSPNILTSSDNGATWTLGGRLTFSATVGYVAGYYKYWGNGVDRIDFFGTEAHPRDNDNSLWHGYVKGGKSYNSLDEVKDENITDNTGPDVNAFTRVFATGTTVNNERFNHMWNSDVMRYDDGVVAAIGMGRTQNDGTNPDHSFLYFRFSGGEWKTTYLGKAGKKLYSDEQDYVGLGALHPNDQRIVYISTPIDPRSGMNLSNHEIFMGVTCDEGATFQWSPITWNSQQKNIRPIVPKWDGNNMVVLWNRGTYDTAQIYNMDVVGVVTQN